MGETFIDEYGNEKEDALGEQNMIDEFNNSIKSTQFHVYGLSGDWGTGKSTFVQMWIKSVDQEKFSIIKIDAFESDYMQNPFTVIYTAFKCFMKENGILKKDAEPIVKKAKKIAFASLKSAGKFGINLLIDKIGKDNVKELVSTVSDSLFDEFDYNPEDREEDLCTELKDLLTQMVKKSKKQLYIVIDELDRCRPDFALETLEKIKHLFAIDGVKFILIYNPQVIANIVKNKYGIDDTNNRYIKKFIEMEIPFNTTTFYKRWLMNEAKELREKGINPKVCEYIASWSTSISKVMLMYRLSLRDTQRILSSIDCNNLFTSENFNVLFGATIAFFKGTNKAEYEGMIDYLQKNNSSFASNAPVRTNYNKIAALLMEVTENTNCEDKFVEYFKNMKQYGNL